MNLQQLIKTVKKIFPGSTAIEITPSEAGRILSKQKKNKKNHKDENQKELF